MSRTNTANLFHTQYAQVAGTNRTTMKVLEFLVNNSSLVLDDSTTRNILRDRSMMRSSTPLSLIYQKFMNSNLLDMFTCIFPTNRSNLDSIPDLLTLSSINLDIAMMDSKGILKNHTMYEDKILLNMAGLLRYTGNTDQASISDTHELQSLIVRGLLCRSFFNTRSGGRWLSPRLCRFLIETYAMIITSQLSRTYGLDANAFLFVASKLALYIANQITNTSPHQNLTPDIFLTCSKIGTPQDLKEVMERNSDVLRSKFTLGVLCEDIIAKRGPARMRNFSQKELNKVCGNLGTDNISNLIQLEYPPYFAHQIILAISGDKNSLMYGLQQQGLLKDADEFAKELSTSGTFMPNLEDSMKK